MINAHVIENGVVVNTIVVKSLDIFPNLIEATDGGIGWSYDGKKFIAPPPAPISEPAPAPTKEQLLAQLQALQAQIQALE
jgi:hypothetical protein